jgi:hypothetical protein
MGLLKERLRRLEQLAGKAAPDGGKVRLAELAKAAAAAFRRHGRPVPEVVVRVAEGRLTDPPPFDGEPVWGPEVEVAPGVRVQFDTRPAPVGPRWYESDLLPQLLWAVDLYEIATGIRPVPAQPGPALASHLEAVRRGSYAGTPLDPATVGGEFVAALAAARELDGGRLLHTPAAAT